MTSKHILWSCYERVMQSFNTFEFHFGWTVPLNSGLFNYSFRNLTNVTFDICLYILCVCLGFVWDCVSPSACNISLSCLWTVSWQEHKTLGHIFKSEGWKSAISSHKKESQAHWPMYFPPSLLKWVWNTSPPGVSLRLASIYRGNIGYVFSVHQAMRDSFLLSEGSVLPP